MLSYSRGHDAPLIEASIWEVFRKTAARFPDEDALVVRHQGVTAHVFGAGCGGGRDGARTGGAGVGCAGPDGRVVDELRRVGADASGVRADRRRAGERESGVSGLRSGVCAAKVQDEGAVSLGARTSGRIIGRFWKRRLRGRRWRWSMWFISARKPGSEMLAEGRDDSRRGGLRPDDVTNIQYTSGTTGSPKGVLLTHRNLLNNAHVIAQGMKITRAGQDCAASAAVSLLRMRGRDAGFGGERGDDDSSGGDIRRAGDDARRSTWNARRRSMAFRPCSSRELEHPDFRRFDFSSLRTGVMAGAPCPVEIMKRVVNEMHCAGMTIIYGQTESSPVITMSAWTIAWSGVWRRWGRRVRTRRSRLFRRAARRCRWGRQGELCTRGYLVMKGYDQEPEATRRAIDEDGWLHTGDLATMRHRRVFPDYGAGEGYDHPRRRECLSARGGRIPAYASEGGGGASGGLPDARLGEAVAAWIRVKEPASEEEIREFCRGRIAHFKIPQYIRFVDAFPMTVTGKIQKFRMREIEIEDRELAGRGADSDGLIGGGIAR